LYNIGDYVGKMFSYLIPMGDGMAFYIYSSLRGAIFVVCYGFCVMWSDNVLFGSQYFGIALHLLLGLTNGHITTINFGANAKRLMKPNPRDIGTGAGLIVLHLLFGLVVGTAIDVVSFL